MKASMNSSVAASVLPDSLTSWSTKSKVQIFGVLSSVRLTGPPAASIPVTLYSVTATLMYGYIAVAGGTNSYTPLGISGSGMNTFVPAAGTSAVMLDTNRLLITPACDTVPTFY